MTNVDVSPAPTSQTMSWSPTNSNHLHTQARADQRSLRRTARAKMAHRRQHYQALLLCAWRTYNEALDASASSMLSSASSFSQDAPQLHPLLSGRPQGYTSFSQWHQRQNFGATLAQVPLYTPRVRQWLLAQMPSEEEALSRVPPVSALTALRAQRNAPGIANNTTVTQAQVGTSVERPTVLLETVNDTADPRRLLSYREQRERRLREASL